MYCTTILSMSQEATRVTKLRNLLVLKLHPTRGGIPTGLIETVYQRLAYIQVNLHTIETGAPSTRRDRKGMSNNWSNEFTNIGDTTLIHAQERKSMYLNPHRSGMELLVLRWWSSGTRAAKEGVDL